MGSAKANSYLELIVEPEFAQVLLIHWRLMRIVLITRLGASLLVKAVSIKEERVIVTQELKHHASDI